MDVCNSALSKRAHSEVDIELPLKKRLRRYTQIKGTHVEEPKDEPDLATSPTTLDSSSPLTDSSFSPTNPDSPPAHHSSAIDNGCPQLPAPDPSFHTNKQSHEEPFPHLTKQLPETPSTSCLPNSSLASLFPKQVSERQIRVEEPKIWAKRRQGLCDALPYFKAHQGSLYTINNLPLGILIDKEARSRDKFDGQVIITTVGGGRVRDETTGKMIRVEDQAENRAYRAFKRCHEESLPVVVIAGRDHPLYPVEPPHPYCVLDYFQVTDVWAEKQIFQNNSGCRIWCIRLEKVCLSTTSWWDPSSTPMTSAGAEQSARCSVQVCDSCSKTSKKIFTQGWFCLNHECTSFFKIQGTKFDPNNLQYTQPFLAERSSFSGQVPPLIPPIPSKEDLDKSHGSEKALRVGIVCPDCGCCSSRRSWVAWECEDCPFRLPGPMRPYPEDLLIEERRSFNRDIDRKRKKLGHGDPVAIMINSSFIAGRTLVTGRYTAAQYLLPGDNGKLAGSVTVLHADEAICSFKDGPNDIFQELCTQDIGLRRNSVTRNGAKTEVWTRHFAQNWGAPYKFAVSVQSKAFDEAPPSILKAVHRMLWAGKAASKTVTEWLLQRGEENPVAEEEVVFNELLSLGYMEDDRISYHDDGEKQLGPTVATLSLGSPATMSFRPKKKATFSTTIAPKKTGEYQEVLCLPLSHGDLVVMHGAGIHRLYDHKVDPQGCRRFALTCRYIDPKTMANENDQEDAITKGRIPDSSFEKYAYDGDEPVSGSAD